MAASSSATGTILKHVEAEEEIKKKKTVTWSLPLDHREDHSDLDSTGSDEDWTPSRKNVRKKGGNRLKQRRHSGKKVGDTAKRKKSLKVSPGKPAQKTRIQCKRRVRQKQSSGEIDSETDTPTQQSGDSIIAVNDFDVTAEGDVNKTGVNDVCEAAESGVNVIGESGVNIIGESGVSVTTVIGVSIMDVSGVGDISAVSISDIVASHAIKTTADASSKTTGVSSSNRKRQPGKMKLKNLKPTSKTCKQKSKLDEDIVKQDAVVGDVNMAAVSEYFEDEVVSVISESDSDSDFEEVKSVSVNLTPKFTASTDLKTQKPDIKSVTDINKTIVEVEVKENKNNFIKKKNESKRKKEKSNTVKNKKVTVRGDNSDLARKQTVIQLKGKKTDVRADKSNMVNKKKTDKPDQNSNLGKRTMQHDNKREQIDKVKRKKLNDNINEEKLNQSESLKQKSQSTIKVVKPNLGKRKKETNVTVKKSNPSKMKKNDAVATTSGSIGRKKKRICSSNIVNVTLDETDVTAVLLKMEGLNSEQTTSDGHRGHQGEDNSSALSHSESEDEDWEVVKDHHGAIKSQIPDEPVEITLSAPNFLKKKRKKNEFDWVAYVRRQVKRFQRDVLCDMHKVHLMCLLSWGMKQNLTLNSEQIYAQALSLLPETLLQKPEACSTGSVKSLVQWFRSVFTLDTDKHEKTCTLMKLKDLEKGLLDRRVTSERLFVAMFVIFLRVMSFNTRLILSFHPVPILLSPDKKSRNVNKKLDKQDDGESRQENENCNEKLTKNSDVKSKNKPKKSKKTSTVGSDDVPQKKRKCKYFKNKMSTPPSGNTVDKDCLLAKESKTISSKLSTKLKQSTSENSDSDIVASDSKPHRKLRPKPASRMLKECDNSDESGYEDAFVPNEMDSDVSDDELLTKSRRKKNTEKNPAKKKITQDSLECSSSSEFEEKCSPVKNHDANRKMKGKSKKKENRIVSKQESLSDVTCDLDSWVEVYLPKEKRWICVDCVKNIVDRPQDIDNVVSQPVCYIFAFSTDLSVKDVTCRYASEWLTQTRKLRVDADWLNKMLEPYKTSDAQLEIEDNENMKDELLSKPLPKSVGEFKNHPLYVLKRHLLKFEALYPNSVIPVGYIKGEPIYARECVHTLHSRENWLKEGRSVKLGEESYKMVKSRKWKVPKINPDALDLELFGYWQTEIYVPLPVIDGKIPRNGYGNLELFKDWMLPVGTVQVKLPGLNKIANKLGVDCVAAMIGWDTHGGFSHPLMDGWVVCIEHREALEAAWEEDQQIQLLREVEKRQKRALGNWKLLTRSLIIGDRLKKRFDLEKPDIKEVKDGKKADDVHNSWPRNREQNKKESTKQSTKHFIVETM